MNDLYIGVDFGQQQDYTAIAIIERALFDVAAPFEPGRVEAQASAEQFKPGPSGRWVPKQRSEYHVKHLQRFPLRTSYPAIVQRIVEMKQRPELAKSFIVADQTGVGRPIIDMLHAARLEALGVTITGGTGVSMQPGVYAVGKKNLISRLQMLLQSRRLKFAEGLPDAKVLIGELQNYQMKVTESANETFNAREGQHDDLVLAVALGVWMPYRQYGIDG